MPLALDVDCSNNLPDISFHSLYSWADVIEILCLAHDDMEYGIEEYAKLQFHQQDIKKLEGDVLPGDSQIAIKRYERWEEHGRGCLSVLRYRASIYDDFYPFKIDGTDLFLADNFPTEEHIFYIYLLICSNLRYFNSLQGAVTNDFECVSLQAMKELLPNWAESYVFGTANCGQAQRYAGNVDAKLDKLAADVRGVKLRTNFPKTSTGDAGLDIVSWLSLDKASHFPTYFAQCGCTDHWNTKQFSATFEKWHNTIHLPSGAVSLVFVPHCLRGADGMWHNSGDMGMSCFIDRSRLVKLYSLSDAFNLPINSSNLIHSRIV